MDTQANHYITGDPAFAVDQHGAIVLWNEAAEQSFGVPEAKALGKKCWDLLSGEDTYGNRYCCRHCPIREMGFRHEPVHGFQSTFKTGSDTTEQFSVSCVTVYDEPGSEMLLHICHPDNRPMTPENTQVIASSHPSDLSERELEILALLADKVRTKDIATTLNISIRTVRTHIQHVMYKLQVHKRNEAIKAGKRLKLI
jgi:PAS domain S-box-containing protein